MELRILGAHNMESRHTRMESHLIDGVLALDAGGMTRALTFEEQRRIQAIILSHRHFDHVRDLLPLGLALRNAGIRVEIYAIQDTVDFLMEKLLDGSLYPNVVNPPPPYEPVFHINVVDFYTEFEVLDYSVMAVPVPHAVPAAGFRIASGDVSLFYTGDAGEGVSAAWEHVSPDVLLTEVTYGNDGADLAARGVHLTPATLEDTLLAFKRKWGRLPRVITSHLNPPWEDDVRRELVEVAARLGIEIEVSQEDMTLTL